MFEMYILPAAEVSEKQKTWKFRPNHNETLCAPLVMRYLLTDLPLSGNDNSIQLHLICLLWHYICISDNYLYVRLSLNINLIKTKDRNIKVT